MPKAARKMEPAARGADRPPSSKKLRLPVLLITAEDELWRRWADLSSNLVLKQLDSIDELISTFPRQPGIILWMRATTRTPPRC